MPRGARGSKTRARLSEYKYPSKIAPSQGWARHEKPIFRDGLNSRVYGRFVVFQELQKRTVSPDYGRLKAGASSSGSRRWPELREEFNGVQIEKQHTVVFYAGALALVSEPLIRLMDDESLAALFIHEGLRFMFNRELSNTEALSDHETQEHYLHTIHAEPFSPTYFL